MTCKRRIAFVCYLAVCLLLTGFGVRYYFGHELMPYHLTALGVPWASLPESVRFLLIEFMHGVGAGFLVLGLALFGVLAIPFRRGEPWADWLLPLAGLGMSASLVFMLCRVMGHSEARPPIGLLLALIAAQLLAAFLTLRPCGRCRTARG